MVIATLFKKLHYKIKLVYISCIMIAIMLSFVYNRKLMKRVFYYWGYEYADWRYYGI